MFEVKKGAFTGVEKF